MAAPMRFLSADMRLFSRSGGVPTIARAYNDRDRSIRQVTLVTIRLSRRVRNRTKPSISPIPPVQGRGSVVLDLATVQAQDAVLVATDHDGMDYALIAHHARLIIDTRNVFTRRGFSGEHIVKA
jgi:UDP-N-acetyl-D-mannosaminuronate dehydrogenase